MGRHARLKKSRVRPVAAVFAAAAAVTGAGATATAASAATEGSTTSPSVPQLSPGQQMLRPGTVLTAVRKTAAAGPRTYTVRTGDDLSSIAAHLCGVANDWLGIWHATHGIPDPNIIDPGKVLTVACNSDGPGYSPPVLASYTPPASTGNPGYQAPQQQYQQPVYQAPQQQSGNWPGGAFGNCVVARESSGNAQVMNSTGHYGLYQFSASTWAAYGGSPAEFGNASVAEQERVFMNAIAAGGQGNWSQYDGC